MKRAQGEWKKITSDEQMKAQRRAQEKYERDRDSELYLERQEGIKEGEHMKMKELAINMKMQGLDDEFISKCLNTDLNTLKDLLND